MPNALDNREDPKFDLAAEMLRSRGTVRLKAWGASMVPSIWPGDLLTIQSVAHDEVVPGDIVLVMRDNRFVVHRLVERRRDKDHFSWITRGDAMPHDDPPAVTSELLGRVAGVCHANRSFVPSRRVSLLHSVLAWMLCRSGRFRNLALRIHAAQPGQNCLRQLFSIVFGAGHEIPAGPFGCNTAAAQEHLVLRP